MHNTHSHPRNTSSLSLLRKLWSPTRRNIQVAIVQIIMIHSEACVHMSGWKTYVRTNICTHKIANCVVWTTRLHLLPLAKKAKKVTDLDTSSWVWSRQWGPPDPDCVCLHSPPHCPLDRHLSLTLLYPAGQVVVQNESYYTHARTHAHTHTHTHTHTRTHAHTHAIMRSKKMWGVQLQRL